VLPRIRAVLGSFWGATGIIALIRGVVLIVNAARQMERAAVQSSRANEGG
jgi:hypothetical protein